MMSDKSTMIEDKLRILADQIDIFEGLLDKSEGVETPSEESSPIRADRPIANLIGVLPEDLGLLQDRLFNMCARFENLFVSDGTMKFDGQNTLEPTTDIGGTVGVEHPKVARH